MGSPNTLGGSAVGEPRYAILSKLEERGCLLCTHLLDYFDKDVGEHNCLVQVALLSFCSALIEDHVRPDWNLVSSDRVALNLSTLESK